MIFLVYVITICIVKILISGMNNNAVAQKVEKIICFGGLLLIAILRSETVGQDVYRYLIYFERMDSINTLEAMSDVKYELGFSLLTKVLYWITNGNQQFYLAIISVLILIGPFVLIGKYSENITMSCVLFVSTGLFFHSICVLRSWLAISLLCFAKIELLKEKKIKALLLTVAASFFHISAIVAIAIYFLTKVWKKGFIIWLVGYIAFWLSSATILEYFIGLEIFSRFDIYPTVENTQGLSLIKVTFLLFPLFASMIFSYMCFDKSKENSIYTKAKEKRELRVINESSVCIASWLQVIERINSVAFRVVEIFAVDAIILMPNTIVSVKDYKMRMISYIFTLAIVVYYLYLLIRGGAASGSFVYKFFWQ